MEAKKEDIKIYGRLVNVSTEGVAVDSEQVWDSNYSKSQTDVNKEIKEGLENFKNNPFQSVLPNPAEGSVLVYKDGKWTSATIDQLITGSGTTEQIVNNIINDTVYTKTEVDDKLNGVYTKSQIDSMIDEIKGLIGDGCLWEVDGDTIVPKGYTTVAAEHVVKITAQ